MRVLIGGVPHYVGLRTEQPHGHRRRRTSVYWTNNAGGAGDEGAHRRWYPHYARYSPDHSLGNHVDATSAYWVNEARAQIPTATAQ